MLQALAANKTMARMETPPRRPAFRLHRSSCCVLVLLTLGLLFVNVPGDRNSLGIEFRHGWPATYLYRTNNLAMLSGNKMSVWPWIDTAARWGPQLSSLEGETGERFMPSLLAFDVLLAFILVIACTTAFEIWRRRRVRLLQFRIAELLVVVAICACICAWCNSILRQHEEERAATAAIEELGGLVWTDTGKPDWLPDAVGDHWFKPLDRPERVYLGAGDSWCGVYLASIAMQNAKTGDAELRPLGTLKTVVAADLSYTQLTDDGLNTLASLKRLEELSLASTKVSDAGVGHLIRFKALKKLDVRYTRITPQGCYKLRQALPDCVVDH